MSEQDDIRRILVALDASSYSLAALHAAVALAAEQDAELVGLFVEDINLLHLSQLPFAREVRRLSATDSQLSRQRMATAMRIQAARARRALEEAAVQAQVSATFRVARGQVSLEVLAASLEADLLILGRVSQPLTRRARVGSTARTAVLKSERSVLLTQPEPAKGQPVMVTFNGSALAWRALATAVRLMRPDDDLIVVLAGSEEKLREETAVWLEQQGITADFYTVPQPTAQILTRLAQSRQCRLLVLGGDTFASSQDTLQPLLDEIECSLMLVR